MGATLEVEYTAAAKLAEQSGETQLLATAAYFFMSPEGGLDNDSRWGA